MSSYEALARIEEIVKQMKQDCKDMWNRRQGQSQQSPMMVSRRTTKMWADYIEAILKEAKK